MDHDGALAPALADDHLREGVTLGADKGYDAKPFVHELTRCGIAPRTARISNCQHSAMTDAVREARTMQ